MKTNASLPLHLLLYAAAIALAALPVSANTVVLSGSMQSTGTFLVRMAVTIPEPLQTVSIYLPAPAAHSGLGQSSSVANVTAVSTPPATSQSQETDAQGNNYQVLTYQAPQEGRINITVTYSGVSVSDDLTKPFPNAALPLKSVPVDVAAYLKPTALVQSDSSFVKGIAESIVAKSSNEADVARNISIFLQTSISNGAIRPGIFNQDAATVLRTKVGGLVGWAHAFMALARAAGIPARMVYGPVLSGELPTPVDPKTGQIILQEFEGAYTYWAEIWYPGAGWAAYEPAQTLGYTDSFHVPAGVGRDFSDFKPKIDGVLPDGTSVPIPDKDTFDVNSLDIAMVNKLHLTCTQVLNDDPQLFLLSRAIGNP